MATSTAKATGQRLGYVRVSTGKQDAQLQNDALDKAGVLKRNRYIGHGVSGAKTSRPGLDALLADVEPGDTVVVYKLYRLGRSTAMGKAMLQMSAIFAEMERSFIS